RADRGQLLTPEAERGDRLQIIETGDLAGRMPRQRHRQLAGRDTAAVVAHPYQSDAAPLDVDLDTRGSSVQRVLGELLDDRGRPFDHLAGGDLVDEFAGKNTDGHADRSLQAIGSPRAGSIRAWRRRMRRPRRWRECCGAAA